MKWWILISVALSLPVILAQDNGYLVCDIKYYSQQFEGYKGDIGTLTDNQAADSYYYNYYGDFIELATDARNRRGFVIDTENSAIYKVVDLDMDLFSPGFETLYVGVSYSGYSKLAYDWLADNLYWTDLKYNWISMIPVKSMDFTQHRVIIHGGLMAPTALGIDPVAKYLFFADYGQKNAYIERTNLDGSGRTRIVHFAYVVADMVTDAYEKKLYWVDDEENAIYSSDYMGATKTLYRKSEFMGFMGSVAINKDVVCVTEAYNGYVLCINKDNQLQEWYRQYTYQSPWIGRMYDAAAEMMVTHDCQDNTCDYICVNMPTGAQCLCADGYEENENGTCIAKHSIFARGFMIAFDKNICVLEKKAVAITFWTEQICFLTWNSTVTHLAADAHNVTIFFADQYGIYKHDVIENITKTVTFAMGVSGLAYDWNQEYIYWTESTAGKINVMPTAPGVSPIYRTVYSGLRNPSNLTINPHNFTLFWISESDGRYTIQGGTYDGMVMWNLVGEPTLENPSGLFFDVASDRVYWLNSGLVRHVKADGSDIQTQHSSPRDTILVVYKDWILTTNYDGTITVNFVYQGESQSEYISTSENITALSVFDDTTQRFEKGKYSRVHLCTVDGTPVYLNISETWYGICETNNGGCEQVCTPQSNKRRECKCGVGYVLNATDPTDCVSYPMNTNFALTVDFSHKQILQIDTNNSSHIVAIDIKHNIYPTVAIYDAKYKKIFWADYVTNNMMTSDLNGNKAKAIRNSGQFDIYSMAVDGSTGNLFYSAHPAWIDYPYIGVLDPKTEKHRKVADNMDVYAIYSIALYPSEGLMFFVDPGAFYAIGAIGMSSMDGSGRGYLVSSGLSYPNSIAVAKPKSGQKARVYWTDISDETIYSISIDKTDREIFYEDKTSKMAHLAISGGYVYYTATNKQYISKIDIDTKKEVQWMTISTDLGRLESLDVYPVDDLPVHSRCSINNGGCSTFCLPTSANESVCACEDGIDLDIFDRRTCANVQKCAEDLLHGELFKNCIAYINATCQYKCYMGYEKVSERPVTCLGTSQHPTWNVELHTLCIPTTTPKPPTTTPRPTTSGPTTSAPVAVLPQALVKESGITAGTFAAVILALIIIFIVILFAVAFFIRKRRSENMFAHAKFVNSGNVNVDPATADNNYSSIDLATPRQGRGDGMVNPLYESKNGPPQEQKYDNTLSQQEQINVEFPTKF